MKAFKDGSPKQNARMRGVKRSGNSRTAIGFISWKNYNAHKRLWLALEKRRYENFTKLEQGYAFKYGHRIRSLMKRFDYCFDLNRIISPEWNIIQQATNFHNTSN